MRTNIKNKKTVLITGASSGIGLATAIFLSRKGYKVYAGIRDLNKKNVLLEKFEKEPLPVEVVHLDILDENLIKGVINQIMNNGDSIDVLINNAGFGLKGFLEDCSMREIKDQFETNFFGQIAMIQHVLPIMRGHGFGRIINISSIYGEIAFPFVSIYSATKFGMEAITDSLRMELAPFNIQISAIQPSGIRTNFDLSSKLACNAKESNSIYFPFTKKYMDRMKNQVGAGLDPDAVARVIYKAISSKKMKRRYIVGKNARLLLFLKLILPSVIFERLIFKKLF